MGFEVLIITNAMGPMLRRAQALLKLRQQYQAKLSVEISLEHCLPKEHEKERGESTLSTTPRIRVSTMHIRPGQKSPGRR